MAVALDATSTAPTDTAANTTTLSHTGLTVGAGANRALVAVCAWDQAPGAITAKDWDSAGTPQAMEVIVTPTASGNMWVAVFGLVAPTSGNKTCTLSWTNLVECIFCMISFTGVDQTGGVTTFAHAVTNTGSSTSPSIAITSAVGNMTVDVANSGSSSHPTSPSKTGFFGVDGAFSVNTSGSYAAGAASNTHSWTISPTNPWISAGVDIVAVGGGGGGVALQESDYSIPQPQPTPLTVGVW